MTGPSPFAVVADGVRAALRVTPKASRNAVAGLTELAGGGVALKVTVTTVPEDGKANQAVIALLSKAWKTPKSSISVVAGATDRNKIVLAAGDPAQLLPRMLAAVDMEKQR
ncbi:DUF167 domain-containing protein [bacterium]|nr:DUF167 domain-containing protein [bacterium]